MFIRDGIRWQSVLRLSYPIVFASGLWTLLIVYVHYFGGFDAVFVPQVPVGTIGIVVSLYLGFKTNSTYDRWWEARKIWGDIINQSRILANQAYIVPDHPNGDRDARLLINRHLAWVNALAHQLRTTSKLPVRKFGHLFDARRAGLDVVPTSTPSTYLSFLSEDEKRSVGQSKDPLISLLRLQGDHIRKLLDQGRLDTIRFTAIVDTLHNLYVAQGRCERIKNTPFPYQITVFGRIFTWIFIALIPLAFVDVFEVKSAEHHLTGRTRDEYMLAMTAFTVIVAWFFIALEKISESCEDPFEWGTTDVPIATLTRIIEIDLKQIMGDRDIPEPLRPIDGVLY